LTRARRDADGGLTSGYFADRIDREKGVLAAPSKEKRWDKEKSGVGRLHERVSSVSNLGMETLKAIETSTADATLSREGRAQSGFTSQSNSVKDDQAPYRDERENGTRKVNRHRPKH